MKKMKTSPRQRCGYCQESGHNKLTCPKKNKAAIPTLDAAKPDRAIAMRAIISPSYALWLVSEGATGEALDNAKHTPGGLIGDTALQAFAELDVRAKKVLPDQLALMKDLKRKRDAAETAYVEVTRAVAKKLGYD